MKTKKEAVEIARRIYWLGYRTGGDVKTRKEQIEKAGQDIYDYAHKDSVPF